MESGLTTPLVLDTGIYVDYLLNLPTRFNTWLDEQIFVPRSNYILHGHVNNRTELMYILCRKFGFVKAKELVETKLDSYIIFHDEIKISEVASHIKCKFPIALVDCFSIATAIFLQTEVYFREEQELTAIILADLKTQFNIDIKISTQ